jgi:GntR family carbon starvation induced transcriptional regulator
MSEMKAIAASKVAPQIRDQIARGVLAPDSKLRLHDLAELYGVSTSAVREALVRLTAEGMVIGEDQRGFRVAEASLDSLEEVTTLRGQFEPYALRLAIERGDDAWEESVVAIFHRLTRIEKSAEPSPELWESTHRDFHMALISGCRMPMLVRFCSSLHDLSDRYRRLYMDPPPRGNVAKEHAAIVDAVLARDADTACHTLAEHSQRSGKAVYERIKALKAAAARKK